MKSYQQFFAEMKRRRVFRVMAAYGIIGFGIIEAAEAIFPRVALPDWAVTLVVWLTLLGFPIAVLLAWAFDSTPEGVRRTEDATPEEISAIIAQPASKRWTAGLLALGGVVLLFGGWWMGQQAARPEVNLGVTDAMAANVERIAVLPFANVGGESNEDVLAAGPIADLHRRYGEWDQAVSAYRRAVQIDPRNPDMLTSYSEALEAVGQLAAADEVAEKALQVAPSVPSVRGRKVETTFLRYGDVRQARNLAAELGLSPGEHEEVRRLVKLAVYEGDWDEASRLTNQEARQEFPFFELGRLLRRGWVESLRGMDTKAFGDSILQLDFESTAGGIGDLADFAAYIYKNDVENAWAFLEEAEGNARAAGELVVLEIALNFATQTKARLGRTEEALEALEGMIDQPGLRPKLADLLHDPTWDALRGEPRFDDIIERRRAFEERANHDAEADRPWLP